MSSPIDVESAAVHAGPSSLSRRAALGALGLATFGVGASAAVAAEPPAAARVAATDAKTFVLIHGAWHGGWCWRRVVDRLHAKGHKAFAPTLTGLGERSHLMSSEITLDTHIEDIVNVLYFEDLRDVCLVMHSYAGVPGSGAIEKAADRIGSIVYLDAFMPSDGEMEVDYSSALKRPVLEQELLRGVVSQPSGKASMYVRAKKDQEWVDSRTTAQPNRVGFQPIRLTGARERIAKKTYIRVPQNPEPGFDRALAACRANPTWKTFMTPGDCHHDVMVDEPDWLVDLLISRA